MRKVLVILFQQDLHRTLKNDKPNDMMKAELQKISYLACEMIRFCLVKDQKYFLMRKIIASDLWQK